MRYAARRCHLSQADSHGFVDRLGDEAPPLAHIEEVAVARLEPAGYSSFVIRDSLDERGRLVPVSPDISTCDD